MNGYLGFPVAPPAPLAVRVLAPVLRAPLAVPEAAVTAARVTARLAGFGFQALAALGRVRGAVRRTADADGRRRAAASELQALFAGLLAVHGLEVRVRGELPGGPCVIVANHLSYLDPVVLGSLAPCSPVAKRELAGWPLIGFGARKLGVTFVDRGCPWSGARVLREGLRALRAGVPVLGFPEGTTTDGTGPALPFRRGLFGLARIARVPVVPVAISFEPRQACWIGDDPFFPHYLATAARRRTVVHVAIGRALHPEASPSADELAATARRYIDAMRGPAAEAA